MVHRLVAFVLCLERIQRQLSRGILVRRRQLRINDSDRGRCSVRHVLICGISESASLTLWLLLSLRPSSPLSLTPVSTCQAVDSSYALEAALPYIYSRTNKRLPPRLIITTEPLAWSGCEHTKGTKRGKPHAERCSGRSRRPQALGFRKVHWANPLSNSISHRR